MQAQEIIRRLKKGLTYEAYLEAWEEAIRRLDPRARRYLFYRRYNFERAQRVVQTYRLSERLKQVLATLSQLQLWMVLTED
jgi:hypothetical protein